MNKEVYYQFGQMLQKARKEKGWSQIELAKNLDVKQQMVSRWEEGKSQPSLKKLKDIIFVLDPKTTGEKWVEAAGYETEIILDKPLTATRLKFPFSSLNEYDFETCVLDFLNYFYKEEQGVVHKNGGRGSSQNGVDLEVLFPNNTKYHFQCKRYTSRFGIKQMEKAIADYRRTDGDKCYLVISGEASPEIRRAIKSHKIWDVWDVEDLSSKIREKFNEHDKRKLVDNFFPGQRFTLLGDAGSSVWRNFDEFFAYSSKEKFFNHAWKFWGRGQQLQKIIKSIENNKFDVIFISGKAGYGKSKLLYEITKKLDEAPKTILFLGAGAKLSRSDMEKIEGGEKLLAVDDAHEILGINALFEEPVKNKGKTKLLITTRPSDLDRLYLECMRIGIERERIDIIELESLTVEDIVNLAKDVFKSLRVPSKIREKWATEIAELTHENPLVTILSCIFVEQEKNNPRLLLNKDKFKSVFLSRFISVITPSAPSSRTQRILNLISVIQPFFLEDQAFENLIKEEFGPNQFEYIKTEILVLKRDGLLIEKKNGCQIFPDPLTDFLIENACLDHDGYSVGYIEKMAQNDLTALQFKNLLVNLGRLDWRLSQIDKSPESLMDLVWNRFLLEAYKRNNAAIIEAVESVALFQPNRALTFCENLFEEKEHVYLVPRILKKIALHENKLEQVMILLWKIAKSDERPLAADSWHPIKILAELCSIEPGKPISHCEKVINFALELLEDKRAWQKEYSPFDIIRPIVAVEISTYSFNDNTFTNFHHLVALDIVAPLRKKVIKIALGLLTNDDSRKSCEAVKFINCVLHYPVRGESTLLLEMRDKLNEEFIFIFSEIRRMINENKIHTLILVKLVGSLDWFLTQKKEIKKAADKVFDALPKTLDFKFAEALVYGIQAKRISKIAVASIEETQSRIDKIASEILKENSSSKYPLLRKIQNDLESIRNIGMAASPEFIISSLINQSLLFANQMLEVIYLHPQNPLTFYGDIALFEVLKADFGDGIIIAHKFLDSSIRELIICVVFACNRLNSFKKEYFSSYIEILGKIQNTSDELILSHVVSAMGNISYYDKRTAINELLKINFHDSQRVINNFFSTFSRGDYALFEELSDKDFNIIFNKLNDLKRIDDFWAQSFVIKASYFKPVLTLDFLVRRLKIAEKNPKIFSFELNEHGNLNFRFHESEQFSEIMESYFLWISEKIENTNVSMDFITESSELFSSMFEKKENEVFAFLHKKLDDGVKRPLKAIASIVSSFKRNFVIESPHFIIKLLSLAEEESDTLLEFVSERLIESIYSELGAGFVIDLIHKNKEVQVKVQNIILSLRKNSPEFTLYNKIISVTEKQLKRLSHHPFSMRGS